MGQEIWQQLHQLQAIHLTTFVVVMKGEEEEDL